MMRGKRGHTWEGRGGSIHRGGGGDHWTKVEDTRPGAGQGGAGGEGLSGGEGVRLHTHAHSMRSCSYRVHGTATTTACHTHRCVAIINDGVPYPICSSPRVPCLASKYGQQILLPGRDKHQGMEVEKGGNADNEAMQVGRYANDTHDQVTTRSGLWKPTRARCMCAFRLLLVF